MKIGSMNNPDLKVFDEIERIGTSAFDFIDLTYEWPMESLSANEVKKRLTRYGLEVVGHTSYSLPAIYPIRSVQIACINELNHKIDFLSEVGAKKIHVHPFYFRGYKDYEDIINENIKILTELNQHCIKRKVKLMIENSKPPFHDIEVFVKLLRKVPGLKMHLDVGHLNIFSDLKKSLPIFLDILNDQIIHCHIHDNNEESDEHLPLGCGTIDWGFVAKTLVRANYDSTVTLEVFCPDHDYLEHSKKKWLRLWQQFQSFSN